MGMYLGDEMMSEDVYGEALKWGEQRAGVETDAENQMTTWIG